jgi:hypothetical protein
MQNINIIQVKYLPVTNTQPSRVQLINNRLSERKIIAFDYELNNIEDIAIAYLKTKKIKVLGVDNGYIAVLPTNATFVSIK